jgi:hypothetical protein
VNGGSLGANHFDNRAKGKHVLRLVNRPLNLGFAVQITPMAAQLLPCFFPGHMQISPYTLDELQNAAGFGLPSRGAPVSCRCSLAVSAVSSFVPV